MHEWVDAPKYADLSSTFCIPLFNGSNSTVVCELLESHRILTFSQLMPQTGVDQWWHLAPEKLTYL